MMTDNTTTNTLSPPTPEVVGQAVRIMRATLEWSQETLAELSSIQVRTVQRVEAGQPSSLDTRRALARAFGCPDLDILSRPVPPAALPAQVQEQAATFDREHVTLEAEPTDGRGIIRLLIDAPGYRAIGPGSTVALPREAEDAYAAVMDLLRDCLDICGEAGRQEMLGYGDNIDELAEPLRAAGFGLVLASREIKLRSGEGPLMPTSIIYVIAAEAADPPKHVVVKRLTGGS